MLRVETATVLFVLSSIGRISVTSYLLCSNDLNGSCSPRNVDYEPLTVENPSEKVIVLQFDSFVNATNYTFCYPPQTFFNNQTKRLKFNLVIHVFCRQLGYTTYELVRAVNVTNPRLQQIFPFVDCDGTEQRLMNCKWPSVSLVDCRRTVVVECGHCSKRFENSDSGVIQSPGYPDTFFPLIQCDVFVVTSGDGIDLRFTTFNLPSSTPESLYCSPRYAYIEVKPDNNIQENRADEILSNSDRYCAFRKPEKYIRIESKVVMIHLSGGIFPFKMANRKTKIGVRIEYKAYKSDSYKYILILGYLFLGVIASLFIFFLYKCCHKKLRNYCRSLCVEVSESESVYEEVPPLPPRIKTSDRTLNTPNNNQLPMNQESAVRASLDIPTPITPLTSKYTLICASTGNCEYIRQNDVKSHSATRKRSDTNLMLSDIRNSKLNSVFLSSEVFRKQSETPVKMLNELCHESCRRRLLDCLKSTSESKCNSRDSITCDASVEHSNDKMQVVSKRNSDGNQLKTPPRIYVVDTSNDDAVSKPKSV